MIINVILIIVFLHLIGLSAFHGVLRDLGKARTRGIGMLIAAVLAVVLTLLTKDFWVSESLLDGVLAAAGNQQLFGDLMESSPTLAAMLFECMASLIAPILCLVYFIVLAFVMWIAYLIIAVVLADRLKEHTKKCKRSKLRAGIWGGVWGAVICVMLMVPLAAYMEIATPVATSVLQADILTEESEQSLQEAVDEYIAPVDGGSAMVYRAIGGGLLVDCMTDFSIDDQDIDFSEEVGSVCSLACSIVQLADEDFQNYGAKQTAAVNAVADAFEDSVLLPQIAGDLVYGATDSWLNNRPFLGIDRPSAGSMAELFDPFINRVFEILRQDAHDPAALQRDIRTVADMINIFAEHRVFENLSSTDRLMASLSSNGIMSKLLTKLGENSSMKALIPEVTNLGVRAIATTLDIPGDKVAVYEEFLASVAKDINYTKILPDDQRATYLADSLKESFDEAGIPIDEEILICYSVSMIEDLVENDKHSITADDVQAFFAIYATSEPVAKTEEEASEQSTDGLSATFPLKKEDPYANTVYAGKTAKELQKTGAAALANAYRYLMTLTFDYPTSDSAEATKTVKKIYTQVLEKDASEISALDSFALTQKPLDATYQASLGLQKSETLVTTKVLLSDLLIDPRVVTEKLNGEGLTVEVTAITDIFTAANDLYKKVSYGSNIGLEQISDSVGQILDALKASTGYGSDQTAELFTAILQSKTVRDSANLDVKTATEMAQKATEGESAPNYTQTVTVVSKAVTVITNYNKEGHEVTDEEIVSLIRNINRQSAAMLEIYSTPKRLEGHGVPTKYSSVTAELLTKVFHFMAAADLTDAQYEQEAKALNALLNVAFSARENSGSKYLFAKDGKVSVFSGTADETVALFMSSRAITSALRDSLLTDGAIRADRYDVYDLSAKQPADSTDYADCQAAMLRYYEQHPSEETKLSLYALAALFGITDQPFLG
ncbi:MAG: hypothetical protein IJW49_06045 [Clostridia bacterium]|nr:hypothetical protein [Clostridia bacterium]